jgi:hypothetical protein
MICEGFLKEQTFWNARHTLGPSPHSDKTAQTPVPLAASRLPPSQPAAFTSPPGVPFLRQALH